VGAGLGVARTCSTKKRGGRNSTNLREGPIAKGEEVAAKNVRRRGLQLDNTLQSSKEERSRGR